eukprot:7158736-Alexandrium_andersonii.AAC.1
MTLAVPMVIIPSTAATAIYSGMAAALPCLSVPVLQELSQHVRLLVMVTHPDALAANRACTMFMYREVPTLLDRREMRLSSIASGVRVRAAKVRFGRQHVLLQRPH